MEAVDYTPPAISLEDAQLLFRVTAQVVHRGNKVAAAALYRALVDNANLLLEVNHLRQQLGIPQRPTYKPEVK